MALGDAHQGLHGVEAHHEAAEQDAVRGGLNGEVVLVHGDNARIAQLMHACVNKVGVRRRSLSLVVVGKPSLPTRPALPESDCSQLPVQTPQDALATNSNE